MRYSEIFGWGDGMGLGDGVGWGGDDQVQEEYSISNNTCICNYTDVIYMFTCTGTLNMK